MRLFWVIQGKFFDFQLINIHLVLLWSLLVVLLFLFIVNLFEHFHVSQYK